MAKANMTISAWEKMAKNEPVDVTIVIDGEEKTIPVIPTLPFEDAAEIVETVVRVVLDEDTGEYHPEVLNVLLKAKVLEKYAGFSIPKSFDKIYKLIYSTDAYDLVRSAINTDQYYDIDAAIYEAIEYRKGVLRVGVQAEMQKAMSTFEEFRQKMEEMFSQVDEDEISGMVKNLATMTEPLDANNLVRAVREAQREDG